MLQILPNEAGPSGDSSCFGLVIGASRGAGRCRGATFCGLGPFATLQETGDTFYIVLFLFCG